MKSFHEILLNLPDEINAGIHDMLRLLVIQVVTQFLLYCSNDIKYRFFDFEFAQSLVYLSLGVAAYWFIIRKLLSLLRLQSAENTTSSS